MMMSGRSNRYPFTASQWQELEHQALIFKYMASGHPIPSDLILPIRRSILLDSSAAASLFPHQPNIGWGCFQMGFGRKVEDPEPGRCRRTDGKKWRCSKEAHPDSKYCERHMHRGKNRSRKPVEMPQNATPTNITATPTNNNASSLYNSSSSLYNNPHYSALSMGAAASDANNPFYPYSSSSPYSRPSGIGLSPPKHQTQFSLDSGSSSSDRDYRYFHVLKEEADQYSCFSDGSGVERDGSWRFTPLGMSSLGEQQQPKQRSFLQQNCYSHLGTDYSRDVGVHRQEDNQQQQQHCFVLGADFKLQRPARGGDEEDDEEEDGSQKPLRRFLDDQWPLKHEKQWIDLEDDSKSNWSSSFSKTQLSISTPVSHHDLSRTTDAA